MSGPKLIINADDFGKDAEVNEAIIKSFEDGFLTSASVLMNGSDHLRALRFAKGHSGFSIGIHLNLTEGLPVSRSVKSISCLTGQDGSFFVNWKFRKKCITFGTPYSQIYTELENQILEFLDYGIKPSHIDSHHHIHTLPLVAIAVTKLAKKYGISRIRPSSNYSNGEGANQQGCFSGAIKSVYKRMINKYFKRNFIMPDYFWNGDIRRILNSQESINDLTKGVYELHCHPGLHNGGREELEILTNKQVLLILRNLNIELISFNEL